MISHARKGLNKIISSLQIGVDEVSYPDVLPVVVLGTSKSFPLVISFNDGAEVGIIPKRLLLETSRTSRLGKFTQLLGIGPVKLLSFRLRYRTQLPLSLPSDFGAANL